MSDTEQPLTETLGEMSVLDLHLLIRRLSPGASQDVVRNEMRRRVIERSRNA